MQLHESLLIYRSQRDGRLSLPGWLTHSGHFTHKVVTCQPQSRRRSRKTCQPKTVSVSFHFILLAIKTYKQHENSAQETEGIRRC